VIIEGGHIPPETVRENAFGPLDELRDEIRATLGPQPQRAERALERVVLEPDKMDVVTDNIVQEMAKSGRRKANGLEPIVSYLLAVENEIKLLRIVLLGKLANIPPERLHEHVRELYA
jgi:V/A-type H+-transporting ATPase subunit C